MQSQLVVLRLSKPIYLLLAALTYFLGAGIARYLGEPFVNKVFWLGFVAVILAQMSMNLLVEVFRPINQLTVSDDPKTNLIAIHEAALYLSIAGMAAYAAIAIFLLKVNSLSPTTWLYLLLSLLVLCIYSIPPLRLSDKGFGEVLLAIHLGFLIPSISFLLQSGNNHRFLGAMIIPITFLFLATFLALDFPTYSDDLKYDRQTLLVRIGWEWAIPLHLVLLVLVYILFAFEPSIGISFGLIWPAFLTIPFALLQIYLLRNIALGAKPIWTLLSSNAVAIIGMTVYLLTLTFWLR